MQSIMEKDIEKAVSYYSELLFQITPKETVSNELTALYKNPKLSFDIKKYKIDKIGKTVKGASLFYKVIRVRSTIETKLTKIDNRTDKEKEAFLRLHEMRLLSQYGFGNVNLNKKTGVFEVKNQQKVVGISKDGVQDWKFIELKYEQKEALSKLLPKKLHKEFN